MTDPIDINKATLEQLKTISGISDKRAQKIIQRREEKGFLTTEDLKLMTDIPNTIWDPLIKAGQIIVEPLEQQKSKQTTAEPTDKQVIENLMLTIQDLKSTVDTQNKETTQMKAMFEQHIAEMKIEFEVRLKNQKREHDLELTKFAQQGKYEIEEVLQEYKDREEQLLKEIKAKDETLKAFTALEGKKVKIEGEPTKPAITDKPGSEVFTKVPYNIKSNPMEKSTPKYRFNQDGPPPPKMAIFDGKGDWRPYYAQFNHIANRYHWTTQQRLDKLIECLRDRALKFFTSRSKTVQEDYHAICKKLNERFGSKDLPHIVRRQLQDLRQLQEESLEEFAERAQEMATDGYPETPDPFIQIVATDAFLKGCLDKKAALTAMDKDPDTLDKALQYVKSAVTNQRVILGARKQEFGVKRVTFQDSTQDDDVDADTEPQRASIRAVYRNENNTSDISRLETRLKKTEDDLKETKSAVNQILDILKGRVRNERSRSPNRVNSPRQSPTRGGRCFNCGAEGHFSSQCEKPRNRSPQRYSPISRSPSPSNGGLNFNGLKI